MIGLQNRIALVAGWARQIRTANGYRTDLGKAVDTERIGDGPESGTLLLVI